MKSEKPASKRRVKAADSRGKTMGFADNVFDQKRGGRRESGVGGSLTIPHIAGKKRSLEPNTADGPSTPMRKIDLPTPEPDFSNRIYMSREGSDYGSIQTYNSLPPILPSVHAVTDIDSVSQHRMDEHRAHFTPNRPSFNIPVTSSSILAPLIPGSTFGTPYEIKPLIPFENSATTSSSRILRHTSSSSYLNTVTNSGRSPNNIQQPSATSYNNHAQTSINGTMTNRSDPSSLTPLTESSPVNTGHVDETIKRLEQQIEKLRQYDEEFAVMKLEDARKVLHNQLAELERQLMTRRQERGLGLVERLRREGFVDIADAVGFEVGIEARARAGLGIRHDG